MRRRKSLKYINVQRKINNYREQIAKATIGRGDQRTDALAVFEAEHFNYFLNEVNFY